MVERGLNLLSGYEAGRRALLRAKRLWDFAQILVPWKFPQGPRDGLSRWRHMSSQGLALNVGIIISSRELHLVSHGTKGQYAFGLLFALSEC